VAILGVAVIIYLLFTGCGLHSKSVMDRIPVDQRCVCEKSS